MSLQDFIKTNHDEIVAMTREKVAKRNAGPRSPELETRHGVHLFLDQLRSALEDEARRDPSQRADADPPTNPDIERTAALHGHDLLTLGFSIDEVVHDYGDVCQAVTELAVQKDASVSVADFHTMNRCLDNAIAAAATAWTTGSQTQSSVAGASASFEQHLERMVTGALAIFGMLRTGKIATGGPAADMLGRHLETMRDLLAASVRASTTPATLS